MKKLLGLLAVAPMALAACSGTEDVTPDTSTYFLGHGQNGLADWNAEGKQNHSYQVIAIDLHVEGEAISYEINESIGYMHIDTADLTDAAKATPTWFAQAATPESSPGADDAVAAGAYSGQDLLDNGWTTLDGTDTTDDIDATLYYNNTGETLRYVYDLVPVEFDKNEDTLNDDTKWANKNSHDYGNAGFVWDVNKAKWEDHLRQTYGTCGLANAVTATDLSDMAAAKGQPEDGTGPIGGATASESELYIAAAIKTAQAHCAE